MKRIICALILCISSLFSVAAFADYSVVDAPEAVNTSSVQPYAEETRWVTRIHNGNYEMRLWSITYNKWLTDWIIIGPA